MKVLIIGLGSIAKKHIEALRLVVPNPEISALRSSASPANKMDGIKNIYSIEEIEKDTDFILISNPTSEHAATMRRVVPLGIPLFIEKPPIEHLADSKSLIEIISKYDVKTYVAFNMRFHPALQFLNKHLPGKRLIEANVYCGSYLPDWRPGSDYRKIYSAIKAKGGGVHLDLIHEIDYSLWLFGLPSNTKKVVTGISDLEIDSPDYAGYTLVYENKVVNIVLNYYRKDAKRSIELVFDNETWNVNLLTSVITDQNGETIFQTNFNILDTYKEQMIYFVDTLILGDEFHPTFRESIEALQICLPNE